MRRTVQKAWQAWCGKAGEPDCGGGGTPTQAEHLRRGASAEALAAAHLESRGLVILARNLRCRGGEVDLIASEHGCIVFIEVRLRSNGRFGGKGIRGQTTVFPHLLKSAAHFTRRKHFSNR